MWLHCKELMLTNQPLQHLQLVFNSSRALALIFNPVTAKTSYLNNHAGKTRWSVYPSRERYIVTFNPTRYSSSVSQPTLKQHVSKSPEEYEWKRGAGGVQSTLPNLDTAERPMDGWMDGWWTVFGDPLYLLNHHPLFL